MFDSIYKTYWQKIFRLCMGYVNDYDQAQDLAQETFIRVWEQLPNFRGDAAVGTWIFRIATNTCLRHIEKQGKYIKTSLPLNLAEEKQVTPEPQISFLYQCIAGLPELDRIIISLELEDVRQAEIALIVGLSEANVRTRIYRVKEKLALKFKENGY